MLSDYCLATAMCLELYTQIFQHCREVLEMLFRRGADDCCFTAADRSPDSRFLGERRQ